MACRERRRRGTRCFTLELDEARLADFLVEAGVLTTIAADFPPDRRRCRLLPLEVTALGVGEDGEPDPVRENSLWDASWQQAIAFQRELLAMAGAGLIAARLMRKICRRPRTGPLIASNCSIINEAARGAAAKVDPGTLSRMDY